MTVGAAEPQEGDGREGGREGGEYGWKVCMVDGLEVVEGCVGRWILMGGWWVNSWDWVTDWVGNGQLGGAVGGAWVTGCVNGRLSEGLRE